MKWIALTTLLLHLGLASAAPPLPPAVQAQLDRAVIEYESGRLDEARQVFEALSRRGGRGLGPGRRAAAHPRPARVAGRLAGLE